jgi:transcriptional regulator with XRE-family HTH domain
MYPNLKIQIFKRGIHQNHLGKELGIPDTVLSKIIHGYREPTSEQRQLLAHFLNVDESWLFEKFETEQIRRAESRPLPQTESKHGVS